MEKKSNISALEKIFIKTGKILAVRAWDGGGVYEIDIHLPKVNFEKWDKTQSLKCRTSSLHYTDYSLATWNGADKTCTLYIDANHNGQGSRWAKQQLEGNTFYYLNIEAENHFPVTGKRLVCLGDVTSIGHFCALQQLATPDIKIDGFISFNGQQTATAFNENCPWLSLKTVLGYNEMYNQTEEWIKHQTNKESNTFYITGNAQMVVKLRKLLKQHGVGGSQIKSKGFWQ